MRTAHTLCMVLATVGILFLWLEWLRNSKARPEPLPADLQRAVQQMMRTCHHEVRLQHTRSLDAIDTWARREQLEEDQAERLQRQLRQQHRRMLLQMYQRYGLKPPDGLLEPDQ